MSRGCVRRSPPGGDDGSAVVEFVSVGVLLLVPLVYLVLCLGRVQAAAFAAEGAARVAARSFAVAATDADGAARAGAAASVALGDFGFEPRADPVAWVCSASPCLTPQARITATVSLQVRLPGVPGFVGRAVAVQVPVRASHVEVVDTFRAVDR